MRKVASIWAFTVSPTLIEPAVTAVTAGSIKVGDTVNAQIDATLRNKTRLNHSATHLLHEALRRELGDHILQKGSLASEPFCRM